MLHVGLGVSIFQKYTHSPAKKKNQKKKLEALERLYRSKGLIFLQWRKEVFNNYHSIPAF